MRLPRFTADASLGARAKNYALTSKPSAQTGVVLPQFCFHQPGSLYSTCVDCFDTDGDGIPDTCWTYSRPGPPFRNF